MHLLSAKLCKVTIDSSESNHTLKSYNSVNSSRKLTMPPKEKIAWVICWIVVVHSYERPRTHWLRNWTWPLLNWRKLNWTTTWIWKQHLSSSRKSNKGKNLSTSSQSKCSEHMIWWTKYHCFTGDVKTILHWVCLDLVVLNLRFYVSMSWVWVMNVWRMKHI